MTQSCVNGPFNVDFIKQKLKHVSFENFSYIDLFGC